MHWKQMNAIRVCAVWNYLVYERTTFLKCLLNKMFEMLWGKFRILITCIYVQLCLM